MRQRGAHVAGEQGFRAFVIELEGVLRVQEVGGDRIDIGVAESDATMSGS